MKLEEFTPQMREHLVSISGSLVAFVPPPLPTAIDLSQSTVVALADASAALGRLSGVGQWMPNPYLLIRPFLRREAVLSSRIEGAQASLSDVMLYEASPARPQPHSDVREVVNYVSALEAALSSTVPIGLAAVRELHRILMTGVRGQERSPGEFRRDQNYIAQAGAPIEDATYVPPPVLHMQSALEAFEAYLASDTQMPLLAKIGLSHYQFEAIHPFLDGNGRVGRLLVSLLLVRRGLIGQPLLYLSAYFERERNEYYTRLGQASKSGDLDGWLRFFLTGVSEQAIDAVTRASRLFQLRERYHQSLHAARASSLPLQLVDQLFMSPYLTIPQARDHLGVTYRGASLNISKLVDAGILRELTGRERNRVFVAEEILRFLEEPLTPPSVAAGGEAVQEAEQQELHLS